MPESRNSERARIYDTTLRDGEQMPGVAFTLEERLAIASALDRMGIDEIEIGFAASGELHRRDMRAIVELGLKAKTLSLGRPLKGDIDAALEVGVDGVILFTSLSDRYLKSKLGKSFEEVLKGCLEAVRYAVGRGTYVQLTFEDATRMPMDRLLECASLVAREGVDRIGLADTVGVGTPAKMKRMVTSIRDAVSVPLAVHCHDDFGMAVANTLAAMEAGVRFLSTTVNGIGERAGNASMEECILAIEVLYGIEMGYDLTQIESLSALVARASGVPIPANKAVVGANSFRHESGIHVAAQLKDPLCYEPYSPSLVGRRSELVLGKSTGRTALRHLLGRSAEDLDDAACQRVMDRIKALAEQGEVLSPENLLAQLEV